MKGFLSRSTFPSRTTTSGTVVATTGPFPYHTGSVYEVLLAGVMIERVEFVAPAFNPKVALLAPAGEGEKDCNVRLGVVITGMNGGAG